MLKRLMGLGLTMFKVQCEMWRLVLGFCGSFLLGTGIGIQSLISFAYFYVDLGTLGRIEIPLHKFLATSYFNTVVVLVILGMTLLLISAISMKRVTQE